MLVCGQLLGLLFLIRMFELENRTVFFVLLGASAGFVVHALLPLRRRLGFFAMLSVASVPAVLGVQAGAVLLAIGGVLIGVCHLRASFRIRVALLLILAAALVVLRTAPGLSGLPWIVGPLLGSMFMFRLALYLHAMRHNEAPSGPAWSAAYFFMAPNVCFPLYPVVDYATFVRTHFDADHFRIYERGIRLMFRGTVHLLVYRLVYYDLAMDPLFVNTLADVVRYVGSTFLLYVKISGQFHLIAGLLCLFGFRLPDTNHLYFLASSPSDFWRRINIYWKDFMMKLVYYPSFFRLRRHGNALAVAASTVFVFAVTWALHSWQSYWLVGSRVLAARDLAFWVLFGVVALAATLWEMRDGRGRHRITDRSWSLARGLGTVGTFALVAVLWSLWNAHSFPTWLHMWSRAANVAPGTWPGILALLVVAVAAAGFGWGAPTLEPPRTDAEPIPLVARRAGARLAAVGVLAFAAAPFMRGALPDRVARVLEHLQGQGWSPAFVILEQQGYYEQLTDRNVRVAAPWYVPEWSAEPRSEPLFKPTGDFLLEKAVPSARTTFLGAAFSTNQWGMRDREYAMDKPAATWRVALFGPSFVMGWGVADDEVFEGLVEAELDSAASAQHRHAEILNFGMSSYSIAQQVLRLEKDGLRFRPDLIVLTMHPYELTGLVRNFERTLAMGLAIPDTGLARIAATVGLVPGRAGRTPDLALVEEEMDVRSFTWARELSAKVGAHLAVLALRVPGHIGGHMDLIRRAATTAGVPLLDCSDLWDGSPVIPFRISGRDSHPNAEGHRKIAECFLHELTVHAHEVGLEQAPF